MLRMSADSILIEKLGGPTKLAGLLGFDKARGPQRVHNWTKRGIPAAVKVARPDLFLLDFAAAGAPGAPALTAPQEQRRAA